MLDNLFSIQEKNKTHLCFNILGLKLKIKKKVRFPKTSIDIAYIKSNINNIDFQHKRACIFASFNKDAKISDNVVKYLQELQKYNDYIILVADNPIERSELNKIDSIVDSYIFKRHGEYDFGSYKRGFFKLKQIGIFDKIETLLFCNDSVAYIGNTLFDVFKKSENKDFYGMTGGRGGYKNKDNTFYPYLDVPPHIQSYFFMLSKNIFLSDWFEEFFSNIKKERKKLDVVRKYEFGLSYLIQEKGFGINTYYYFDNSIDSYIEYLMPNTLDNQIFLKNIVVKNNIRKKEYNNKISIVTTSYNYEEYIKETIESVQAQTYTDWEMLIIDDGSTDSSIDIINSYIKNDNRIKLVQHEGGKNKGLKASVQLGIKKAQGDWLIFLESDDYITPNYIEEKLKIIKKYRDIDFIFNDVHLLGDEKRIKFMQDYFSKQYEILRNKRYPAYLVDDFKDMNIVPTFSCVMVKKEAIQNINFNSINKASLDWHIWSQIAYNNAFYFIDKKLTNWRLHSTSYIERAKISDLKFEFFKRVQIKNNICNNKYILLNYLCFIGFLIKLFRRSIIRVLYNKDSKCIILFGHLIKIGEIKEDDVE